MFLPEIQSGLRKALELGLANLHAEGVYAIYSPMSRPRAMGMVFQVLGNRWVGDGSLKEPGASGLTMPSAKIAITTIDLG